MAFKRIKGKLFTICFLNFSDIPKNHLQEETENGYLMVKYQLIGFLTSKTLQSALQENHKRFFRNDRLMSLFIEKWYIFRSL